MRRRKIVKCPLCKTEDLYFSNQVICESCMKLWKLGKKLDSEITSGNKDLVRIQVGNYFVYNNCDEELSMKMLEDWSWYSDAHVIIMDLTGCDYHSDYIYNQDGTILVGIDKNGFGNRNGLVSTVTRKQAEAIKKMATYITLTREKRYADGFNAGRNLLQGLASGSISIDEYNKLCLKNGEHE